MPYLDDVICPVSSVRIDSNTSRLTVFMNALLIGLYLFSGALIFMLVVAVDYAIRATWSPNYSPLRWIATQLAQAAGLPTKQVDYAPKLFASRVGFVFAALAVLFAPVSPTTSVTLAAILFVFALLDSVVNLCFGCLTYTYLVLPLYRRLGVR